MTTKMGMFKCGALLLGVVVGCGGHERNAVSGSFQGATLSVASSNSGTVTTPSGQWTKVWLSSGANICTAITTHAFRSSQWLTFDIFSTAPSAAINSGGTGATPITALGTYVVYDDSSAQAPPQAKNVVSVFYGAMDAQCVNTSDWRATSGTVTITSVSSAGIEGSFDITFPAPPDAHITGTFNSTPCTALADSSDGFAGMPLCN